MLQSHYSSTLDFSNEALNAAEKGYRKLMNALDALNELAYTESNSINKELQADLNRLVDECYKNMSDDFNTAKTLAVLFEMASRINDFKSGNQSLATIDKETFDSFKKTYIGFIQDVLGLQEETVQDDTLLDGIIQMLIDIRKKARTDKNFALSDKIRDDLKAMGVQLNDGKDGSIDYVIE
jgi:cysteinyl-tRNA synthetase